MEHAADDSRFLPGADDRYLCCTDGSILSVRNGMRPLSKYFASYNNWSRGRVNIYWEDGTTATEYACELIWRTFIGEIPEGYTVEHINRDRDDDSLENLRLVTLTEFRARVSRSREDAREVEAEIKDLPTKMFVKALNMVYYHVTQDDIGKNGDVFTYESDLQRWTGVMDGPDRMILTSSLQNLPGEIFFRRTLIRSCEKGREKYDFVIEGRKP